MKVILLDRDGVINRYPGDTKYVTRLSEFVFLPKAKEAIALLCRAGFGVIVISNQAGVGKGIYSPDALQRITKHMRDHIKRSGGRLASVYYCVHTSEDRCACRKPKPGMIKKARARFSFTLKNTYFVGDTIRDVLTAQAGGCKSILVLSGKEKLSNRKNWDARPDHVFKDLWQTARFVVNQQ